MLARPLLKIPSLKEGLSPVDAGIYGLEADGVDSESIYSDHDPFREDDILVWNIQNQGKAFGASYNNGLGLIEDDAVGGNYEKRLKRIAVLLADIVKNNPGINFISLQEAPLLPRLQTVFWDSFVAALPADHAFTRTEFMQTGTFNSSRVSFYRSSYYAPLSINDVGKYAQCCELVRADGKKRLIANIHIPYNPAGSAASLANLITLMKAGYTVVGDSNIDSSDVAEDKEIDDNAQQAFYPAKNNIVYDVAQPTGYRYDSVDLALINKQDALAYQHEQEEEEEDKEEEKEPASAFPDDSDSDAEDIVIPEADPSYYIGLGKKEVDRLLAFKGTLPEPIATMPPVDGQMVSYFFKTKDEAENFALALEKNGITGKKKTVYPFNLELPVTWLPKIFEEALQAIAIEAKDDPQTVSSKTHLIAAIKDLQTAVTSNKKLSPYKAMDLAVATRQLCRDLALKDEKKAHLALAKYQKEIAPFRSNWGWRMILGAVVGAVVGFIAGAILGAALGPGGVALALAGSIKGAMIGAGIAAPVGLLVGGGLGLWQDRKVGPYTKVEETANDLLRLQKR